MDGHFLLVVAFIGSTLQGATVRAPDPVEGQTEMKGWETTKDCTAAGKKYLADTRGSKTIAGLEEEKRLGVVEKVFCITLPTASSPPVFPPAKDLK